jgi:cytoskeletal protein CcmA (bactofilin family)
VRKQLILHATGRISGKVRYARIKVEEGAELSGDVGVLEKAPSAAKPALNPYVPSAG